VCLRTLREGFEKRSHVARNEVSTTASSGRRFLTSDSEFRNLSPNLPQVAQSKATVPPEGFTTRALLVY